MDFMTKGAEILVEGVKIVVKVGAKNGIKLGVSAAFPAYTICSEVTPDVMEALYDLRNGDLLGATLSIGSGVFNVLTVGWWGMCKDSAKEIGKAAAIETTKKVTKEATKKIGQEASKNIAKGMSKSYAVSAAQAASKEAQKQYAKMLKDVLGKKMLGEIVERASYDVTKNTVTGAFTQGALHGIVKSGGSDFCKNAFEEALGLSFIEISKRAPKESYNLIGDAFKKAATENLTVGNKIMTLAEKVKSIVIGGIKYSW